MGFFNNFPYTNFHEQNLDWIVTKIKSLSEELENYEALNNVTIGGIWDISKTYKKWTIVNVGDSAYMSIIPVPPNVDIENEKYWLKVADVNPEIVNLENVVKILSKDVGEVKNSVNKNSEDIAKNSEDIAKLEKNMKTDITDEERKIFLDNVYPVIGDYLAREYKSNSIINADNVQKVIVKYDDEKNYSGWIGARTGNNTFVGTDKETIGGVSMSVFYLDCSSFINLLTSGRAYEYTIHKFAADGGNTDVDYPGREFRDLLWLCGERTTNTDTTFCFDWRGIPISNVMCRLMDAAGIAGKEVVETKGATKTIHNDILSTLKSGDILFFGNMFTEEYKRVNHCAMFIKSLESLNSANPGYIFRTYNGKTDENGYIVETSTHMGNNDYQDVIRIRTITEAIDERDVLWAYPPVSNIETSSRKRMRYTMEYSCKRFSAKYDNLYNISEIHFYKPKDVIKSYAIQNKGYTIPINSNLNNLYVETGYITGNANVSTLVNKPEQVTGGIVFVTTKRTGWNSEIGYQELINFSSSSTSGTVRRFYRYCLSTGAWSAWAEATNS